MTSVWNAYRYFAIQVIAKYFAIQQTEINKQTVNGDKHFNNYRLQSW